MHVDDWGIEEQVRGGSEREAGVESLCAAVSIGVPASQEVDRQPWRTEPEIEPARQEQLSEEGYLSAAFLQDADLSGAHLEGAYLKEAHLEGTMLSRAHIEDVQLKKARESGEQHVGPSLSDAQWGSVNLAVVNWSQVDMLGDEYEARQNMRNGKKKLASAAWENMK